MVDTLIRSAGPFAPPVRSTRSTIIDVAEVREGLSWLDPADLVESYNCMEVQHVDMADCTAMTAGFTKEFGAPTWVDGIRFVVQGGIQCKGIGFDPNDARLRAAFEVQEANGVAEAMRDDVLNAADDLTPAAGGVTPAQALGLVESAGHCAYAGYPVIHMGAGVAGVLGASNGVVRNGDILETHLGTPIAVSCGYETTSSGKLDAEQWMYVTGAVVLARSETAAHAELNRSTNDWTVLFERMYVAAIDCFAAKVKVKVF